MYLCKARFDMHVSCSCSKVKLLAEQPQPDGLKSPVSPPVAFQWLRWTWPSTRETRVRFPGVTLCRVPWLGTGFPVGSGGSKGEHALPPFIWDPRDPAPMIWQMMHFQQYLACSISRKSSDVVFTRWQWLGYYHSGAVKQTKCAFYENSMKLYAYHLNTSGFDFRRGTTFWLTSRDL